MSIKFLLKSSSKLVELSRAGDIADTVDAMEVILHSLRKVMGDSFVDSLFTIKLREEYVCPTCSTARAEDAAPLSPSASASDDAETEPVLGLGPGVVNSADRDVPMLSVNVFFLRQAGGAGGVGSGGGFDAVLRRAAHMQCDVVHCKRTSGCRGKALPCRRTLRAGAAPAVFALELIHDSLRDSGDPREIANVLAIVQPRIDLNVVS